MKNEKGFTLIEIIAVLVILGILAAVAVPKYVDLQGEAQKKALQGALAAGASNATMEFARYTLVAGSAPSSLSGIAASLQADDTYKKVGDFTVSYASAEGDKSILVTVTGWPYGAASTIPTTDSVNSKMVKILP